MDEAKKQYEYLLEIGDLQELFPSLSGIWEEDKDSFMEEFSQTDDLINIEISYDDKDTLPMV